ncbi:Glycosyl hydrolases family 16 [Devosia sp. YR412]|uniref:glycoside hydrolase family 16 protein n=1 Tax=Devosia sp. YR412 TaxID=1881030 RepID=UPI0008CCC4B3|nr:glycoside hydrolase family 16 protein [Devosia sp. YR412]SEP83987.1 Glycosyl hydrolases family 16 [Devosia sp. YR412]
MTQDDRPSRRLIWSDECDAPAGTPPDPRWWTLETGDDGWGNQELQRYTDDPANAFHDGEGNLVIRAKREPHDLTSARLISKGRFEFQYGRLECRARVPAGSGLWSAVWMLGNTIDLAGWPACGEIDVMEQLGAQPNRIFGTLHVPGHSGKHGIGGEHTLTETLSDEFHVFAVDWQADRLTWSMDGAEYFSLTAQALGSAWRFDHPFYILLNLAVGGWLGGEVAVETAFPADQLINYVRVYAPD